MELFATLIRRNVHTMNDSNAKQKTHEISTGGEQVGDFVAIIPVWRVLFDADQFGASHFDAMPIWRATVWRVFQFDAWQFGAVYQFGICSFFTFSLHAHTFGTAQGDE